jgi:hypothetical protein
MLSFLSEYSIKRSFGVNVIQNIRIQVEKYVDKYIESRKAMPSMKWNLRMDTKESERIMAHCFDGEHVGAGNNATDIIVQDVFGKRVAIDIKCVSSDIGTNITNTSFCKLISTEHSYTKGGRSLEHLIKKFTKKVDQIKSKHEVDQIMYLFVLTTNKDISFSMAEIKKDYDTEIYTYKTKNAKKTLYVGGLLDTLYGKIKVDQHWSTLYMNLNPRAVPKVTVWSDSIAKPLIINNINNIDTVDLNSFNVTFGKFNLGPATIPTGTAQSSESVVVDLTNLDQSPDFDPMEIEN